MSDPGPDGGAATQAPGAAGAAGGGGDGVAFDPLLLLVLLGIALLVSLQNWWLRRRAQGKPVLPEFLSRRLR